MISFLGAAAALTMTSVAIAQDQAAEPSVTPLAIEFSDSGLSGPGGDLLKLHIPGSQFIAVGESHGLAGPPALTRALAAEAAPHGFDKLVIETGPHSARFLGDTLREGGMAAYAEAMRGRELGIPFINLRGDAEMVLPFVDGTIADYGVWGVDQEFIGSSLILLDELGALATNDEARALVTSWKATDREALQKFDMQGSMLSKASGDDYASLYAAFADSPEALAIIKSFARSAAIYAAFGTGDYYGNNTTRIDLIREQFLDYYHAESKPPKALLRLGAIHLGKGITPVNTYDLGSLIEGIAAANKMEALHIAYYPLGGERFSIRPSPDGLFATAPIESDLDEKLASYGVDMAAIDSDGHYLIDLEALRKALGSSGINKLDRDERFWVMGYDYLIVTRAAEPGVIVTG